ncbi:hypothetical protein [Devosia sp.]|uniref:hypothetical protein n=1 Tax=Devosia sp. TaxID=1871048 RepID=UPI003A93EA76
MSFFAMWGAAIAGFFSAPANLFTGDTGFLPILASAGLLLGIVGLLLSILWREVKALWMVPLAILASLAPFILGAAYSVLAMVGVAFLLLMCVVMMPIVFTLIAHDASRRLPIWLLAGFVTSLAIVTALSPLPVPAA